MTNAQERVVQERDELRERLDKLDTFIVSEGVYQTLTEEQKALLIIQSDLMKAYHHILVLRLFMWTI